MRVLRASYSGIRRGDCFDGISASVGPCHKMVGCAGAPDAKVKELTNRGERRRGEIGKFPVRATCAVRYP